MYSKADQKEQLLAIAAADGIIRCPDCALTADLCNELVTEGKLTRTAYRVYKGA